MLYIFLSKSRISIHLFFIFKSCFTNIYDVRLQTAFLLLDIFIRVLFPVNCILINHKSYLTLRPQQIILLNNYKLMKLIIPLCENYHFVNINFFKIYAYLFISKKVNISNFQFTVKCSWNRIFMNLKGYLLQMAHCWNCQKSERKFPICLS